MALGSIVIDLLMRTGAFETDSKKAEARLKAMQKTAEDVGRVLGTAIAGGVTVATAAVISWTNQITELSEQTRILSDLSGTTSTMFQEWAIGAQSVGIEQDKLADILKDVQDKIGDFIQTGGGPLADFFENIAPKIGLTAEQLARMSGPDALQAYVSALESANLSQSEMTFYMEAIASDSAKLIPLLADGGREMHGWGVAAHDAGAIMSDEMIAALRESQKEIDKAKLAFLGMKIEVVEGITPAVRDFTDLLNDADTREGLSLLANGLITITTKAAEAAAAIGNLVGRYTEFLSNKGFIPTDNDSTLDQLEARQAKLKSTIGKSDGFIGQLLYGDKTVEQLRKELADVEGDIAAFPFRGVSSTSSTTAGQPRYTPYTPPSKSKEAKGLTDAEKEAQKLLASYDSMSARLNEQIELYGQTGEAARVRYETESGELKGLSADQKAILIQQAEHLDLLEDVAFHEDIATESRENHATAVADQQQAVDRLLSDMKFEQKLLGLSNIEREREVALRYAGADATKEQRDAILAQADALYYASEQAELMLDVKDGLSDMFVDFISGAKSAKEAFGDFADMLFARALEFVADQAIQAMFDAFSGKGGGGSGGGSGGFDWAGLVGSFFGGARAFGGPVDAGKAYLVGENGPEMVVPRASGTVVPAMQTASLMAGGGAGVAQTNHFHYAAPYDARTEQQVAARIAFETQRASNRNR